MAQVIGVGALTDETVRAMLLGPPGIHSLSTQTTIYPSVPGWRLITLGSALAINILAPVSGDDDFKIIQVISNTAFAHTVTAPSAIFLPGTAAKTVATFAAFAGANLTVRCYQGKFLVLSSQGITFS